MMIVGLHSGEQLMVQDKSYFVEINHVVKQVFISEKGDRRFLVDESRIEFYNEPNTQGYIDRMNKSVEQTYKNQKAAKEGVEYV